MASPLTLAPPTSTLRHPGSLQGWVLVATAWLSVAAATVIGPILPRMTAHFASGPGDVHVGKLIALVATLPALMVALFAAPVGALADSLGTRRVLLSGLVFYGVCGIAPLWMNTLPGIIYSRVGVGIAEAVIITCGTALLGDFFSSDQREKWFAIQAGTANLSAVFLVLLGGLLGERSWRVPFSVYAISFVLFPLVLFFTWNPAPSRLGNGSPNPESSAPPFRWLSMLPICLVTLFASAAFFVMVIQQSFLLTDRGFSSPRLIGLSAAAISVAIPLGSILFRLLRISLPGKLTLSFALLALGFTIIAASHSYAAFLVGGAINGLGSGIVLPTLITWALAGLTPRVRGFGTGLWQASLFLGQFLSPFSILLLAARFGGEAAGRSGAVEVYALACGLATLVSLAFMLSRRRPAAVKKQLEAA